MKRTTPGGLVAVCERKNGSEVQLAIEHHPSNGARLKIRHISMGFDGLTTFQRGSIVVFPSELPSMIEALQCAASVLGTVKAHPKHKFHLTPRLARVPGPHEECQ